MTPGLRLHMTCTNRPPASFHQHTRLCPQVPVLRPQSSLRLCKPDVGRASSAEHWAVATPAPAPATLGKNSSQGYAAGHRHHSPARHSPDVPPPPQTLRRPAPDHLCVDTHTQTRRASDPATGTGPRPPQRPVSSHVFKRFLRGKQRHRYTQVHVPRRPRCSARPLSLGPAATAPKPGLGPCPHSSPRSYL